MILIDADELRKAKFHPLPYTHIVPNGENMKSFERGWNAAIDAVIENAPTVNAVEVKHGHWEIAIGYDPKKAFQCSECRLMSYDPTEFCSHCGSRMDEVTE